MSFLTFQCIWFALVVIPVCGAYGFWSGGQSFWTFIPMAILISLGINAVPLAIKYLMYPNW